MKKTSKQAFRPRPVSNGMDPAKQPSKPKFSAHGFLYNPEISAILLHKRDDKTQYSPNRWAFFGGGCEETELPAECFRRELQEELTIVVRSQEITPLCDYFNEKMGIYRYVFFVESTLPKSAMKLTEGADFDWIPLAEVFGYDLSEKTVRDLHTFENYLHGQPGKFLSDKTSQ